jgi:hypothetical protein
MPACATLASGATDLRTSLIISYDLWLASWETAAYGNREREPKPGTQHE